LADGPRKKSEKTTAPYSGSTSVSSGILCQKEASFMHVFDANGIPFDSKPTNI
jgi:hypothetical protein